MKAKVEELKERLAEVQDLTQISRVLHWDQQTMMAPRGGPMRAEQIARMLMETRMSPVEIAQAMGYSSIDNMRRFFQRLAGKTPLQFRRECGHR